MSSAICCSHVNEIPLDCRCDADCCCREKSCKKVEDNDIIVSEKLKKIRSRLRQKVSEAREKYRNNVDGIKSKAEWLYAVDKLYHKVFKYVRGMGIGVKYAPIKIEDSKFGCYVIQDMFIYIGNEEVIFSPRPFYGPYSVGQVEVIGKEGTVKLILKRNRFRDLNGRKFGANLFAEILEEIME